jgi:flavin-binding protein dodecin
MCTRDSIPGADPTPEKGNDIMGKQAVAKIIELVGSSDKSWSEAADTAVQTASKSIKNITGVEVVSMTAHVENGTIVTFKSTVKIAFGVED